MHNQYTTKPAETQDPDVLIDVSASGNVRPWAERKTQAELLQAAYLYAAEQWQPQLYQARHAAGQHGQLPHERPLKTGIGKRGAVEDPRAGWLHKAARIDGCATWTKFELRTDGTRTLNSSNFCRCRLCPMCSWRRSLKLGGQLRQVVAEANRRHVESYGSAWGWALLTLTVENVPGDAVGDTIDRLHKGLVKMSKAKVWTSVVRGWIRATEVTHNTDPDSPSYDTYHPHLHVLLMVPKSYFRHPYTQAEWQSLWAIFADLDYLPIVDIRKVKADDQAKLDKALAEVCKYAAKPSDMLLPEDMQLTARSVAVLDKQLHHRRMTAYGGKLYQIAKELHLDDPEEGDLVHTGPDQPEAAVSVYELYTWRSGRRQYRRAQRVQDKPSEQLRQDARADRAALAPALAAHRAAVDEADRRIIADVLDTLPGMDADRRQAIARRLIAYSGTIKDVVSLGFVPDMLSIKDAETVDQMWGDDICATGPDSPETLPPTSQPESAPLTGTSSWTSSKEPAEDAPRKK